MKRKRYVIPACQVVSIRMESLVCTSPVTMGGEQDNEEALSPEFEIYF